MVASPVVVADAASASRHLLTMKAPNMWRFVRGRLYCANANVKTTLSANGFITISNVVKLQRFGFSFNVDERFIKLYSHRAEANQYSNLFCGNVSR